MRMFVGMTVLGVSAWRAGFLDFTAGVAPAVSAQPGYSISYRRLLERIALAAAPGTRLPIASPITR